MAVLLYEALKQSRGIDAPLTIWKEFIKEFLHDYLAFEIRVAHLDELLSFHQVRIRIKEYNVKFNSLCMYALYVVATMRKKLINIFIYMIYTL